MVRPFIKQTHALMETDYGVFKSVVFRNNEAEVIALICGTAVGAPLVRIQSACLPSAVFKSTMCDCQRQVEKALSTLKESSYGIMIYLPNQEARGHGLFGKVEVMKYLNQGMPLREAQIAAGRGDDLRTYEHVPMILAALGVSELEFLGCPGRKTAALESAGIVIIATRQLVL